MGDTRIELTVHELLKMLIPSFRYALTRDNHLMPTVIVEDIENYLSKLVGNKSKLYWTMKYIEETNSNKDLIDNMSIDNKELMGRFRHNLESIRTTALNEAMSNKLNK